jgi:DNA adenine methylase
MSSKKPVPESLTARVAPYTLSAPLTSAGDAARTAAPQPPLKWAGGKRWQVPYLRGCWGRHSHRRLVEPFCGGLAVALALGPGRALLNDVNPHVINFYRWVTRGLTIPGPLLNTRQAFYEGRDRFNALLARGESGSEEAARLFYYLNRTGYNGLCRFNRSGLFNVPFGRYARINYRSEFADVAAAIGGWEFACATFDALGLEPDDFVYADPPYDVEFTQYSQGGFGWDEQVRTAEWLAAHRGPVVLSNQATPRVLKLYRSLGYQLTRLEAPRRISCTGDRTPAGEVLAMRNVT